MLDDLLGDIEDFFEDMYDSVFGDENAQMERLYEREQEFIENHNDDEIAEYLMKEYGETPEEYFNLDDIDLDD
ncbi:hypothetical protein A7981_04440 [Methylovorus sp. MM2]|uniref:hypothetical protein n=1 Tax=Methylovorus sp. MM2 TaxID=1848038 RepID=UPI0007DEFCE7|nr:hypothetical protein [Methylovorus sp. MM2]OAM52705.1 hypothetical protein A7981_04440 [Methylovorus sp. MM2]